MQQNIGDILNTEEAAKLLRVSKRTLLREIQDGKLQAFRVGKAIRIKREALNAYIENQMIRPGDKLDEETDEAA